ncbi:MAG: treY, partial [Sphingomonas bacterium]|nr:treY [Sphingomonas bacterium]
DHVDGLADPVGYCRTLRARLDALAGERPSNVPPGPAYLVIEKILARGERLSPDWQTDGTTGYEYMNEAAALLHAPEGEAVLTDYWHALSARPPAFETEEEAARREILLRHFSGQLDATVHAFHRVARSDLPTRDIAAGAIRRALIALLAVFPAYRTYGTGEWAPSSDAALLAPALERAKSRAAPGERPMIDTIAGWLGGIGSGDPELRRDAVRRFQQLSAPVSAKAVEDTAFYRYLRLISRNDVGSDPDRLSASIAEFHAASVERAATFPHALLTTATHDHKRGEDVRARLAVLSELAPEWVERAAHWRALNARHGEGIDPADEYQLYQTLVGAWPLDLSPEDQSGIAAFADRVSGWQQKALREGKLRSSWTAPDEAYEAACEDFLRACLDVSRSSAFLADLTGFVKRIAPAGAMNGIVQAVLRCTVPGVPDLYQGAEYWDLSLVDPDNRRPVDFATRQAAAAQAAGASELLATWRDGRVKQAAIVEALHLRREHPALFLDGGYEPLDIRGSRAANVIAFVRRHGDEAILVAAALRCAGAVAGSGAPSVPVEWWGDTVVDLPAGLSLGDDAGAAIPIATLLDRMPAAIRRLRRG